MDLVRDRAHPRQRNEEASRSVSQDGIIPLDFWTSPTLDELARTQNVGPLDVGALLGTWPGQDNDGFDDAIDELRHAALSGALRSSGDARREDPAMSTSQFEPDPVIEAYKHDIDRTLLRENLRRTVDERVRNLMALQRLAEEARRAGRRAVR